MALDTTVEQHGGDPPLTILALAGELDASNFGSLVAEVQGLYAGGTRRLLLDLTDLRFMASSGLVALHSIVRILQGDAPDDLEAGWGSFHTVGHDVAGGDTQTAVQLCGPQPAVQRVLDRTGLARLFVIHPDRTAALAAG
jgi:anti-anti-sigma factor